MWVWFVGDSAFKAIYGRFSDDASDLSWTKDYLQVSGNCRDLLTASFPEDPDTDRATIRYEWPGGSADGFVKFSTDRHHLSWATLARAPAPWRLATAPTNDGPETLPGNPDARNTAEANAVLATYKALGLAAYLVAVKLKGESGVLHIRVYVDNPPPDLAFADLNQLPLSIQRIARQATPTRACASAELKDEGATLTPEVAAVIAMLEENPNLLLTGPPGTGKSVLLDQVAKYIENPGSGLAFDPDLNHTAVFEDPAASVPGKTRTVIFHPSYSYDNLVLGLMPVPAEHGVDVKISPGPLLNLAHYASGGGNRALLILDEFNRGNAAAILGDALALLDRDKRGLATIDLPYGELPIDVPGEFSASGSTRVSSRFTLPPNLWIIAAMNSSDRSVAPLDAALRRRFSIVEMPPDYDILARHIGASNDPGYEKPFDEWEPGIVSALAVDLLKSINLRIEAVLGLDFRLGHSNFWHVGGSTTPEAFLTLVTAWDNRILQTLRLALQDNDEALAAILRAARSDQVTADNLARCAWWKEPDAELGANGQARLDFQRLSALEPSVALTELLRLANK